jgi:hypothetical protein
MVFFCGSLLSSGLIVAKGSSIFFSVLAPQTQTTRIYQQHQFFFSHTVGY